MLKVKKRVVASLYDVTHDEAFRWNVVTECTEVPRSFGY
jgi:hypothetical protein